MNILTFSGDRGFVLMEVMSLDYKISAEKYKVFVRILQAFFQTIRELKSLDHFNMG